MSTAENFFLFSYARLLDRLIRGGDEMAGLIDFFFGRVPSETDSQCSRGLIGRQSDRCVRRTDAAAPLAKRTVGSGHQAELGRAHFEHLHIDAR